MSDFKSTKNNSTITGTSANDEIWIYHNYVTVRGGSGDDFIAQGISAADDDDLFSHHVSVNGGAGSDTIGISGNYAKIDGGDDDDDITVSGENATVTGGAGNDSFGIDHEYSNTFVCTINDLTDGDSIYLNKKINGLAASKSGGDLVLTDADNRLKLILKNIESVDAVLNIHVKNDTVNTTIGELLAREPSEEDYTIRLTGQDDSRFIEDPNMKVYALAGNDQIYARNDNITAYGGTGNDTLQGAAGNDSLYGEAGNDRLEGRSGDDLLEGGDGADLIYGGAGRDNMKGNNGNDTLKGETGNDSMYGGAGNDLLEGGDGDDLMYGEAGLDILYGGNGRDTLRGYDNNDTLFGGADNDRLEAGNGEDYLQGDAGADLMYGGGGRDSMKGNDGNDTMKGETGNDSLYGGAGNDLLEGGDGADLMYGDDGLDILYGGNGNDTLKGCAGNDSLFGGANNDLLEGGDGADYMQGDAGLDILYGGNGNDTLKGGDNNDTMFGGANNDRLEGGNGDDQLRGDEGADLMYGGGGRDSLRGNDGNDTLKGETGNDSLYGGAGNDLLEGGDGADLMYGDNGHDILYGGNGNDTLKGCDGNDSLFGGANNDLLEGGVGDDYMQGDAGHDILYGGSGHDTIKGGDGNDTLNGGAGDDAFYGGEGNDVFWHDSGNDVIHDYAAGMDTISFNATTLKSNIVSGQDVLLSLADGGTITVKNGVGQTISYRDKSNTEKTLYVSDESSGSSNDLRIFKEIVHGKANNDKLTVSADQTQVYGLAGNDTIESSGKKGVLLIGGSGDDELNMAGGSGTLAGGEGKDTFSFAYSEEKRVSAVIEDIDPANDKILVNYEGSGTANLQYAISNGDVIWSDDRGYFSLTLKGASEARDYYDQEGNDKIWEVFRLVNQEREKAGVASLTLSKGLMSSSSVRAQETVQSFSHTRPNGSSCFTAVQESYWSVGENIAAGHTSSKDVMTGWMNSTGHRANILNADFSCIGVGYTYSSSSTYKNYWVQMFGGKLTEPDTQNTDNILTARITLKDSAGEHTLTNSGQVRENSSAAMLPVESVPAFGSDNAQLASLVSMTQTDSLGALAGSGTGLTPVDASSVGMIAANETTANVLTNRKKVG